MSGVAQNAARRQRGRRFVVVGVVASLGSLAVQQCALAYCSTPAFITLIRLAATLPLVYLGYSRFVLADVFAEERAKLGASATELRMFGRVASSLGASIAAKLLLEPSMTGLLLQNYGTHAAGLSVLLADFTYGPLVNYLVLVLLSRRKRPPTEMAPQVSALSAASLPTPLVFALRAVFKILGGLGLWRRPRPTTGDFPQMTLVDKIHWIYKADRPLFSGETSIAAHARLRATHAGSTVLRLCAVGDLLPYARMVTEAFGPLDPIADLLISTDITLANLECPLRDESVGQLLLDRAAAPTIALSIADFDALTTRRAFDVVVTANNHAMDDGLEGVLRTIDELERRGSLVVGSSRTSEESERPRLLKRRGLSIGFVASTFGLNGHEVPAARYAVDVEPLNALSGDMGFERLQRRIRKCREAGAQLVVVSLHWGHEFECTPRIRQRELAQRLVNAGADVLFGHHPHVLQPMELLESTTTAGHFGLVLYSVGSLTNLLNYPAHSVSGVAAIGVGLREDGQAYVTEAEIIPVIQLVEARGRQRCARIERLSDVCTSARYAGWDFVREAERIADCVIGSDWRHLEGRSKLESNLSRLSGGLERARHGGDPQLKVTPASHGSSD